MFPSHRLLDASMSVLAIVLLSLACTPGSQKDPAPLSNGLRIIDLTHAYDENTIFWPTSPTTFTLTPLSYGMTDGGWFYASNTFCTPEHGGTHLDAPIHFGEGMQTVAEIPVERFVAPAVVLDVAAQAAVDSDYKLSLDDVQNWEKDHGAIPSGSIAVLRTGWAERWGDVKAYLGDDTPGVVSNLHFPSYGAEAAKFLVESRGVVGLGVDTASIDAGDSQDFRVHRIVAAANVFGLENLADLSSLPATGATLVALPMKIAGGSGAPVRVIAIERTPNE